MKKILITGANSYIGTSFEKFINDNFNGEYKIDTVDMIDPKWKLTDFSKYDSVFHVAGIAHQKETKENAHLYFEINRDLVFETAQKAKIEGVKQFIFLSSMSVYGMETGVITKDTVPTPKTNYGKSKLQAEEKLATLASDDFKVCVLRPPMLYGKGCKGNFQAVINIVKKYPVFPRVENKRSMIYVDNLCSFVRLAINEDLSGLFFPQNREYMNTSAMANWVAESLNKKCYMSMILGVGVIILKPFIKMVKKAFGSLIYKEMESMDFQYCVVDLKESVKKSV